MEFLTNVLLFDSSITKSRLLFILVNGNLVGELLVQWERLLMLVIQITSTTSALSMTLTGSPGQLDFHFLNTLCSQPCINVHLSSCRNPQFTRSLKIYFRAACDQWRKLETRCHLSIDASSDDCKSKSIASVQQCNCKYCYRSRDISCKLMYRHLQYIRLEGVPY